MSKYSYVQVIPRNGKLLRIYSVDPFVKVVKRFDFHPTTLFSLDFFITIKLYLTPLDSLDNWAKGVDILLDFLSSENRS